MLINNGSTDNCKIASITADKTDFDCSNVGPNIVTMTVTDISGNKSTCQSTVTIKDVIAPVPNVASLPNVTGECTATATSPTATDNCAGTVTGTTTDSLTYSTQGTHIIHWSYSDGHGNTSTQNQNVVINHGSSVGDTTAIACNSFIWYGTTYNSSGTPTHTINSIFGCDSTITLNLTITTCTGVANIKTSLIRIYPNPVNNEFVIENKGNTENIVFEIFNSIGQVILRGSFTDKVTVNSSSFASGIYLIKLENGTNYEFEKIVKEN